jgi:tetratricopeptide (TPR) repeat protein
MMQVFNTAVQHHKNGQLDQAELLYRQILDENPDHPDALHLLGVIAHQRGHSERGAKLIRRAIALQPQNPVYHCNLAEACRASGEFPEAVLHSQKAIRLQPHNADAHNHLGLALQAQGKHQEAVVAFREAINLRPDFALAHNNLGGALRELGQTEEALAEFKEAVRLAPTLPLAHSNLGQLLLETGKLEDALAHCREAVRLAPRLAEALSNLGNVLRAQDNLTEAKDCYRRALQLRPNVAMIHGNLGQALQEEGNLDDAITCYKKAIELDSTSARFESHLASALVQKEDMPAAIEHYRLALKYQPNFPEAHNGLGSLLQEQGDFKGAIACFEESLRLKPDFADAYSNLAGAYAELGDLEKSNAYYREALRCDPDYVGAYGVLATHMRDKLPEEDVASMHRFLEREHLSDWKRALLHHGLAHIYDSRKEYDRSAEHARQANEHRLQVWTRQGKNYNRTEHAGFVSFLMKQFSPSFFERVKGWGIDTEVPVFIFGMPRSGTTLIEQILASHPQVFGAGELAIAKEIFDSVPELMKVKEVPSVCMPHMTRPVVEQAGKNHLKHLRSLNSEAIRIVDKMPDNYLWLGFLAAIFPNAKFIYSGRDVHDIGVSCWITNFKQIRWACDQEDIASRIRNHLRIMDHWRKVLPLPMLEIDYEDTVGDLEGTARKLIDFVGLDWDPVCLSFHETKRTVRTASLSQVRQPIYKKSVQRWKNYETALAPMFRSLDEPLPPPPAPSPPPPLPQGTRGGANMKTT